MTDDLGLGVVMEQVPFTRGFDRERLATFAQRVWDARTHTCDRFCNEGGCDWDIAAFVDRVDAALDDLRES